MKWMNFVSPDQATAAPGRPSRSNGSPSARSSTRILAPSRRQTLQVLQPRRRRDVKVVGRPPRASTIRRGSNSSAVADVLSSPLRVGQPRILGFQDTIVIVVGLQGDPRLQIHRSQYPRQHRQRWLPGTRFDPRDRRLCHTRDPGKLSLRHPSPRQGDAQQVPGQPLHVASHCRTHRRDVAMMALDCTIYTGNYLRCNVFDCI
jgi:hypothetical protein